MVTNNVSFFDPKAEADVKRKRAMAEALIEQGRPTGTEKVGRYVVPKSGLEQLIKAGSNAYGQYLGAQASNQEADISAKRQQAIAEALSSGDSEQAIGVLAQDPRTENAAIQMYARKLQSQQPVGIQSGGFEGDIARAFQAKYIQDGMSPEEAAQRAVFDTAQSMRGGYNEQGNWVFNQGRLLNGMQTPQVQMPQQPQVNMPMQPQVNQPMPQGAGGALLPPPSMSGGQPDMSMFQGSPQGFQISGNPKLDQARLEAQAKADIDIATQAQIAQQKAQLENQSIAAPAIDKANSALSVIDQALNHEGLSSSVGGAFGMQGRQAASFPLTEAQRNFQPLVNQIKGTAFLQAFNDLKGGGAITEIEGQKATQAIARLDQAQSEESFRQALSELRGIIQTGIERTQRRAQGDMSASAPAAPKRLKFNPQTGKLE